MGIWTDDKNNDKAQCGNSWEISIHFKHSFLQIFIIWNPVFTNLNQRLFNNELFLVAMTVTSLFSSCDEICTFSWKFQKIIYCISLKVTLKMTWTKNWICIEWWSSVGMFKHCLIARVTPNLLKMSWNFWNGRNPINSEFYSTHHDMNFRLRNKQKCYSISPLSHLNSTIKFSWLLFLIDAKLSLVTTNYLIKEDIVTKSTLITIWIIKYGIIASLFMKPHLEI